MSPELTLLEELLEEAEDYVDDDGDMSVSDLKRWRAKAQPLIRTLCDEDDVDEWNDAVSLPIFFGHKNVSDAVDFLVRLRSEVLLEQGVEAGGGGQSVFIVHGHDVGKRSQVARFVERCGLDAIVLDEKPKKGRTIIAQVEHHGHDADFAIVLLTPDDEGRKQGDANLRPRARQNVILELGYFVALIGREKVCALKVGEMELPSDYDGVLWIDMDPRGAWKQEVAREMRAAGLDVDLESALA